MNDVTIDFHATGYSDPVDTINNLVEELVNVLNITNSVVSSTHRWIHRLHRGKYNITNSVVSSTQLDRDNRNMSLLIVGETPAALYMAVKVALRTQIKATGQMYITKRGSVIAIDAHFQW